MLGVRSIGSRARITGAAQCTYLGSVKTGGERRGFYRDGGAIMCGARRAMSGEIRYLVVLTAGVVDFVGMGRYLVRYFGMLQPSLMSFSDSKVR